MNAVVKPEDAGVLDGPHRPDLLRGEVLADLFEHTARHEDTPSMAGSVACIYQPVHTPTYDSLSDPAKLRYLLDRLHDAVAHLCHVFLWDALVFEQAYQQVQELPLAVQVGVVKAE